MATDVQVGKWVHADINDAGFKSDVPIATALGIHAKSRSVKLDARYVYGRISERYVVTRTAMIAAFAEEELREEAFEVVQQIGKTAEKPEKVTFIIILKTCTSPSALKDGKQIHARIRKAGFDSDVVVGTALVSMYCKCESLLDARHVFNRLSIKNVVSWTAMIAGYAKHGRRKDAFELYRQMEKEGVKPNKVTFMSILNAFANPAALEQGKQVHAQIIRAGFESDVRVGNALITMYGKCGRVVDAWKVFDKMPQRDVVSWTAMISAFGKQGHHEEACKLYRQIQRGGVRPNKVTFISVLYSCASPEALEQGKEVHAHIIKAGLELDIHVGNALVSMYANCGSVGESRDVFNQMPERDVVSWAAMIAGYAKNGHSDDAVEIFHKMQGGGIKPNRAAFLSTLAACTSPEYLGQGRQVHAKIIEAGFGSDIHVGNALVSMYCRCGSVVDARHVFNQMSERDVVSWTAMIAGYANHGQGEEAFQVFHQMQQGAVKPDKITFLCILNACASPAFLGQGKQVHANIIKAGFVGDIDIGNALISMYAKCWSVADAQCVFNLMPERDVVSWTAMIAGYAKHGHVEEAFEVFHQMQRGGMKPNKVTFMSILDACTSPATLGHGKQIHADIIKAGFELDLHVGTTLLSMFARCGSVMNARHVFNRIPRRDVITWNAMIAGYSKHGHGEDAFELFQQMEQEGVKPDKVTFLNMLNTCANPVALERGKQVHARILRAGLASDAQVETALVSMYENCVSVLDQ